MAETAEELSKVIELIIAIIVRLQGTVTLTEESVKAALLKIDDSKLVPDKLKPSLKETWYRIFFKDK